MSLIVRETKCFQAVVKGQRWVVKRIRGVELAGSEKLCLVEVGVVISRDRVSLDQNEVNKQGFEQEDRRYPQFLRFGHLSEAPTNARNEKTVGIGDLTIGSLFCFVHFGSSTPSVLI